MLLLIYILKVILSSTALFGYYFIALRNNKFHQYNRFYLLFSIVASWIIPFMKFDFTPDSKVHQPVYRVFTFISESNTAFESEPTQLINSSFNWMQLLPVIYCIMATIILIELVVSLFKIYRIYKKYPKLKMDNIILLNTTERGTPFSFFKYIFWNDEIDVKSPTGKHILQHELTHVQEKHSWDIIFIQINLVFGWFNPFFWYIKKELEIIHEFIADNRAIKNSNAADFASMLLVAAFPSNQYKLTNPFFFSPIKRRLTMLTQNKKIKFSYVRRVIILPLLAFVVFLFAFRIKEKNISNSISKIEQNIAPSTKQSASQELLNEYDQIVNKNKSEKGFPVFSKFSQKDINRLETIFLLMSKEQQEKQIVFFIHYPEPLPRNIPVKEQIESWKNAKIYGVWIDGKRVSNSELNHYQYTDFAVYFISKLGKNCVNYGKHYYQVDLMTKKGYEEYYKNAIEEKNKYVISYRKVNNTK